MAFAALAAGVSGLQAFSEGVGVIADNITNVNTIGYKESRMRFSTLVTETTSASSYSPGGVKTKTETLVSKIGLLQPSNSATDLSIDGAGFFVVKSANSGTSDGEFLFTRAGAFTQDSEGYLQNTAGLYLMGWPTDAAGTLPNNKNDLTALEPINFSQLTGTAEPTANINLRANLKSSTPINAAYTTVGQMADGSVPADFETNVEVFDSLGSSHTVRIAAAKTGVNEWAYEVFGDTAADYDPVLHPDGLILSGDLFFNTDGTIDLASTTFADGAGGALGSANPTITYATGASASPVTVNFGTDGDADGFSQFDTISTVISTAVDGAVFGNVTGINIDGAGVVVALFDNGLSRKVFQLPLATFPNPDGLARRQGNAFGVSDFSGKFTMVQAGTAGGGNMSSYSLEGSTVDLANEFAELIKTQRAFSASTRIITTADEILTELTRI